MPLALRVLVLLSVPALLLGGTRLAPADEDPASSSGPADAASLRASWQAHQALAVASPFQGLSWTCIGPTQQGGRVVDIEAVPDAPGSWLVAFASGGLWRTDNQGRTFTPLFDHQPTIIMGDVAVDPRDPERIWVGTGENNSSRSSYGGHGMFLSEDGGKTWASKGLLESDRIGRVLVDPRDSRRVFVAALGRLYTPGGERGVFRSEDGGTTWTCVLPGSGWTGAVDLAFHPTDPDTIYAALWERRRRPWDFQEAGAGSGLHRSRDGGKTWTRLTGGLPTGADVGRMGLATSPASPDTLYVSVDHQGPLPEADRDLGGALSAKRLRTMDVETFLAHDRKTIDRFVSDLGRQFQVAFTTDELIEGLKDGTLRLADILEGMGDANSRLFNVDIRGLEVYRSDDAGKTFRRTHKDPLLGVVHTYGYYFGLIRADPTDVDRLYVGGVPLLRSEDGGATWAHAMGPDVHVDHHALWIDPDRPAHLILGNDGGVDESFDAGRTWHRWEDPPVGQFYTLAVDDRTPYRVYGGLQDNGTLAGSSRSRPGKERWERLYGGDGMYVQVDPRDRTTYFGYQFGHYRRKDPDGSLHTVRPLVPLGEEPLRFNWATPVLLSRHSPEVVYLGTQRLQRSLDRGTTWAAISPDLTTSPERGDVPFATITTVDECPKHFGHLWVGTDDGHVHVTTDGGATWRDVSAGLVADRWCTRVIASAHADTRAYATFSGYRDDETTAWVFVTEDRGATWRSLAAGLPAEAVNVLREDPEDADRLWVGTDRGVYVTRDRGATWDALAADLPHVPVHDLLLHADAEELVAATHGRSVWKLDVSALRALTSKIEASALHVFPVAEIRGAASLRRRPPRYREAPEGPQGRVTVWSDRAQTLTWGIRNANGHVLREASRTVPRGLAAWPFGLHVDPERALAAEGATSDAEDAASEGPQKDRPWHEAKRLGHPLALGAGTWTLFVRAADGTEMHLEFQVKD